MRILFLCHYFPPEVNAPASRTHENAKRWAEAGHQVTVVTGAPNAPRGELYSGYRNRLYSVETMDGIKVIRVWTFIAANKGTWRRILNYISYMVTAFLAAIFQPKPDVLIATSPQFFCGWAGLLLQRARRWPFVLEIRDIWPESITTVGAMGKGRIMGWLEGMEKAMYRAAVHIVTVGEGYRHNLIAKGVPERKISVIYNGVDLNAFQPAPKDPEFLRRYGLEGFKVCGYIGTIGLAHGLEIVLHTADMVRDRPWKFLVVGDGARYDELSLMAREKGLDNVVFTGCLPKSSMPMAWSALDACLIHLKKSELFQTVIPSKMFEAMGMGIPILMGVEGEALRIVLEAKAGIPVVPEDKESLLRGCEEIFTSNGMGHGRRGRAFVAEKFNRDKLAEDYLEVLAGISRRPPFTTENSNLPLPSNPSRMTSR